MRITVQVPLDVEVTKEGEAHVRLSPNMTFPVGRPAGENHDVQNAFFAERVREAVERTVKWVVFGRMDRP